MNAITIQKADQFIKILNLFSTSYSNSLIHPPILGIIIHIDIPIISQTDDETATGAFAPCVYERVDKRRAPVKSRNATFRNKKRPNMHKLLYGLLLYDY